MTTTTIIVALLLLVGFGLSFWMPEHRTRLWGIGGTALVGCVFVVLAFTGPEDRYVDLFFAFLAFTFAYRGWRERTDASETP